MHEASKPLNMHMQEVVQPFMLRSQLYSLVDDRTLVDRELDDLRCGCACKPGVTSLSLCQMVSSSVMRICAHGRRSLRTI